MKTIKHLLIKGLIYSYRMDTLAFGYLTKKLK
jgi:hypothetical protein